MGMRRNCILVHCSGVSTLVVQVFEMEGRERQYAMYEEILSECMLYECSSIELC